MPDKEFLEEYGLYRKFPFSIDASMILDSVPRPAIQRFCPKCKAVRTWTEGQDYRHRVGYCPNRAEPFGADMEQNLTYPNQSVMNCTIYFIYFCTDCISNHEFTVVEYLILFECKHLGATGYIMKIGQNPAPSIDIPPGLQKYLGEYEETFKRGAINENQGYGIGAFAYYRRIIENIIDALLDDIAELFTSDKKKNEYLDKLTEVRKSKDHSRQIAVVKELVPDELQRSGNPLAILHASLSVGLHELTEDECLELAAATRQALVILNRHIQLARSEKTELSGAVETIQKKLDKYTKKRGDSGKDSA